MNENLWDNIPYKKKQQLHKMLSKNTYKRFQIDIVDDKIIEISMKKLLNSLVPYLDIIKNTSNSYSKELTVVFDESNEILYCFVCDFDDNKNCKTFPKEIAEKVYNELLF
jgi:hypothetical protein